MTGVTSGQTALATATDSDDIELYATTSLTTVLQTLANLFESATGHDHTGSGKGKPIGSAGIASGIHLTAPVVDSGGLTVTAGGLTVAAGGATVTAGGLGVGAAQQSNAGINVGITAAADATNRYNVFVNQPSGASNNNIGLVAGTAPTGPVTAAFFVGGAAYFSGGTPATLAGALGIGTNAVTTATTGINGAPPAQVAGYLVWQNNGTVIKIPYYLN